MTITSRLLIHRAHVGEEAEAGMEMAGQLRDDTNDLQQDDIQGGLDATGKLKTTAKRRGTAKVPPAVVRTWLRIEDNGESTVLQADKYKLTTKLGIQMRDMRLLDPKFTGTYPSCILCRDKSIVVNMEHIKAIITTKFMLVVNPEDTMKFVATLKERLASPGQGGGRSMQDLHKADKQAAFIPRFDMDLPFELRALEICLDELATDFDTARAELEAATYPALDSLATKVTSPRLERVRLIKSRLVRLTTRVETAREVLEKFLDDDDDMHDLNLTANESREIVEYEPQLARHGRDPRFTGAKVPTDHSVASTDSSLVEGEVAEVEMLLEAYFMNYDNTFNRLETLNEYIKDTEDLVNIKLDQHRNQLITVDLILTALTCAMAMVTTVSGIFGMNLDSGLQEAPNVFNEVTIGTSLGAMVLFAGFVVFAYRRGLLTWA